MKLDSVSSSQILCRISQLQGKCSFQFKTKDPLTGRFQDIKHFFLENGIITFTAKEVFFEKKILQNRDKLFIEVEAENQCSFQFSVHFFEHFLS